MIDYKKSGVDIQAGDQLVSWLQQEESYSPNHSNQTQTYSDVPDYKKRVVSGIGGFASLFDGRFPNMEKPLLISCTDGVGTKVKLASYFNDYSSIGQDLVGMCVNDLICTGGTPLFFLDYYATGKLDLNSAQIFLKGIKKACLESHLVLIGGETAEMPGVYQQNDFDCAGFTVGVVDEKKMWGAHRVQSGDHILGIRSSGFHSNGYSLIRQVFANEFENYKQWLLEPTRLYVDAIMSIKGQNSLFDSVHAAAHITGGGIENLPRVLPLNSKAKLNKWPLPECFLELQKRSGLTDQNMFETFNCGYGMMLVVSANQSKLIQEHLNSIHYSTDLIGEIEFLNSSNNLSSQLSDDINSSDTKQENSKQKKSKVEPYVEWN